MTHEARERYAAATNEDASLRRRLRFDGDTRFVFDRIGARLKRSTRIHRIPERLVVTAFDLVESARQRRPVPSLGNPIRAFTRATTRLPQHPRYPGFLFEQHHNAVVGLHLGVDLIHSHDGFYVLEMNLDAAMGPPRRVLYPEAIDPIVTGILQSARAHGQKRVVVFRQVWRDAYVEEFLRGGRAFGIEVVPASIWGDREPPGYPLVGFPPQREPDTLYVSFSSRHAPIDHFVHEWRVR